MNIGLTTSFIIAGVLLLSILSMNNNISRSSSELTMHQFTQLRANTVSEILQKDIPNIGSDVHKRILSPIKDAQENRIEFESNIDNTGAVETIIWNLTNTSTANTKNPNDKILVRSVDGNTTEFKNGITDFEITYLDENRDTISVSLISKLLGNDQNERDKIRYIEITLTLQSEEQVSNGNKYNYLETVWRKQFTPINLRL